MRIQRFTRFLLSFTLFATLVPLHTGGAAAANHTPQIDAGRDFSIARAADGTVWTWGSNSNGQLGDGTTTNKLNPSQVADLTGVIDVSAGENHTVSLRDDGTVWAWGSNSNGQLGDGTALDRTSPIKVKNLDHVVTVEAGGMHSMAIKENGTLWAWGKNNYYQLGDGTTTNRALPVQVKGITNAKVVALGLRNTLLLKSDGTVWSIGYNDGGQIGDGTYLSAKQFVQVKGLTNVVDIAIGESHAVAVKKDGTVWAWGRNVEGQVGDGTAQSRNQPIQVEGITNAVAVGAGQHSSYAVGSDGTLWSWGDNYLGKLGLGTDKISQQNSPMIAGKLNDVVAIDAGLLHAVALKKDGTVWGMGKNTNGQLGNGGGKEAYHPIPVSELAIGNGPAQKTPPIPTPATPPTTPTTPTIPKTPANSLVVTGTAAKVLVFKAKPYAYVTIMNVSESQIHSNFGSIMTNERGEAVFTGLPAGKYYVIESANGVITNESPIVEVTNEKTANLIDESKIKFKTIVRPYLNEKDQVHNSITSFYVDPKTKEAILKAGTKSFTLHLVEQDPEKTSYGRNHELKYIMKTVTVVASSANGDKHTVIKQIDHDLIDDKSVVATKNGSFLIMKGKLKSSTKKDRLSFYFLQGGAVTKIDPGFTPSNKVDFEFAIATGYNPSEILLIAVLDDGKFEVIRPIP